jgi:hypothetical protein
MTGRGTATASKAKTGGKIKAMKIRASTIAAAITKEQRADQQTPPVRDTGLPPAPPRWEHSNEKARIETDRTGRGSRKVIWHW